MSIPNPWDVGSARLLEGLGFQALATTSAGFALGAGKVDGDISLEEKLAHCEAMAAVTGVPINVDFENGFADQPEQVAINVVRIAETGVAGCSIEDFSRDGKYIYDAELARERVQAAAEAIATLDMPFQLTARAENLLRNVPDLGDTVRRLKLYEAAGADVLYAPGIKSLGDLQSVTSSLERPFNALAASIPGATLKEFADAGAQRVSVGSSLALHSIQALINASDEMLTQGSFGWFGDLASLSEVSNLFDDMDSAG